MEQREGPWVMIWEGDPLKAPLAEDMLTGNGLEVHRRDEEKTRLYVRPNDEDTALDIFRDWRMG